MSTQRTWRDEEFMPAREVNVFQNTTFSYTVDLRATHNSALLQLIFFVAADGYAYLKMAYKLRTFNAPPYTPAVLAAIVRPHQGSAAPRRAPRVGDAHRRPEAREAPREVVPAASTRSDDCVEWHGYCGGGGAGRSETKRAGRRTFSKRVKVRHRDGGGGRPALARQE